MNGIIGVKVENFRGLKDLTVGRVFDKGGSPLTSLTAIIGKNGAGKSSLFDVFGFLSDCLRKGVEEACDDPRRGGFDKIRSSGEDGRIGISLRFRESGYRNDLYYMVQFEMDQLKHPYVFSELLAVHQNESPDDPIKVYWVKDGQVYILDPNKLAEAQNNTNPHKRDEIDEIRIRPNFKVSDKRKLALASLGTLTDDSRISSLRRFLEGWYLSYFTPESARVLQPTGAHRHLSRYGEDLANYFHYLEREHPAKSRAIMESIAKKIPGLNKIDTIKTEDNRLPLRFYEEGFETPFYAPQMSDGTLKLIAYLALLEDPEPFPFICIEEPENMIYPKLLEIFAKELRDASARENGSQFLLTTHQPYFIDAFLPEEVWILEKGSDGFVKIHRASDDPLVVNLVKEGIPLGSLWYSDYFDKRMS